MLMRPKTFLVVLTLTLVSAWADDLPTFDDFRRIDRTRRLTGQMQTAELLAVNQINTELILGVVRQNTNDAQFAWGAAEMVTRWPDKRTLFETALQLTTNNIAIANRFACAAAQQGEYDLALKWAWFCEEKDSDNTMPWLVELWVLGARKQPQEFTGKEPLWATVFRDYSVEATLARIRLLERVGYSPYAARRLGFKPDSEALIIARELIRPPLAEATQRLLKESATYLQFRRPFLLSELVGQTIEHAVLMRRPNAEKSMEVRVRFNEMDERREELKQLYGALEHNTVDFATEKQMVEYFNDVLALGEEDAMKKLAVTVQQLAPPTRGH